MVLLILWSKDYGKKLTFKFINTDPNYMSYSKPSERVNQLSSYILNENVIKERNS